MRDHTGASRLTDAQVLTTAPVAARFFGGNLVGARLPPVHGPLPQADSREGLALQIALFIFAHALHQAGL